MSRICLNLLFLVAVCSAIEVGLFSNQKLAEIRQFHDYRHHFVFFNLEVLNNLRPLLDKWNIANDIKFYYNQCKAHRLPECENSQIFPLILVFNKVLIRFNGNAKVPQQIVQWMQVRLSLSPKYINTLDQLQKHLVDNHNVFCYCHEQKSMDDTSYYYTLSKTFPYAKFCVIMKEDVYKVIGLKEKNFTMFLNSTMNRREYQHENKYQNWERFIKINVLPTLGRADQISSKRFTQENKHLKAVVLTCDYSFKCEQFWSSVALVESELTKQKLGYDLKVAFIDQKQGYLFNLYFNMNYDVANFPALIYIDVLSTEQKAGKLKRYIDYPEEQFDMDVLHEFVGKVQKGQIEQFHLSAKTQKNNGFFGKASEKMVQKLTANSVFYEIQSSQKHYVLLVTALYIGCEKCDAFYKEYKQVASLFIDKDVTFGLLNVYENEVQIEQVTTLPEILLYKKDDKLNPIRMEVNHSFDHLINLIKENLGKNFMDDESL